MTEKNKKTERKIKKEKPSLSDKEIQKRKNINARGRIFEGKVIRKFHKRVTIEFERMIYIKKYERYARSKTKIHARLPEEIEDKINLGDIIQVRECRPLSKIIHFIVIKKIAKGEFE
ncbi:30S ribosomal protein S17 [Candidatus Pacearchaeota archaeon]|nr:MAG: 30S ribosomal protein S17 [Candidatus Pacearchaeota archaeon]